MGGEEGKVVLVLVIAILFFWFFFFGVEVFFDFIVVEDEARLGNNIGCELLDLAHAEFLLELEINAQVLVLG